ncbi:MAG TPA: OmpA family protein [Thermoanaerobaculia bacterium]|nr:OmpA family protein [Thermoanaerobaculia bacterium]
MNRSKTLVAAALICVVAAPAFAQKAADVRSTVAGRVEEASRAIATAESSGAATYANELLDEARFRLRSARDEAASVTDKRRAAERAGLLAQEALHAARAADAKARWRTSVEEVRILTTDISRFGGTVTRLPLDDSPMDSMNRGTTSADRLDAARLAIQRAKSAGASTAPASDIAVAESNLSTVRKILRTKKQSVDADHLSYVAEMLARRAEYLTRRSNVERGLPETRIQRTRLAQAASEAAALAERQRREQAEQQAAELRRQLEAESANRQAQADEIQRLRDQVLENQRQMQGRMETDRTARLDAERALDELMVQYEAALAAGSNNAQVEELRRRVEDQGIALRAVQDRERSSEGTMAEEIRRLRADLERERQSGKVGVDVVTRREEELTRQQAELERLRNERTANETRRAELERTQQAAITAAQERMRAAEQEATSLKSELSQAKAELTRRDATEQDRFMKMQQTLASMAQTRTDTRGFIVTLPGLFFDSGKSTLKPGARNVLSKIAAQLQLEDSARISIEGHTDSQGDEAMNQALSEKRAEAVRSYLSSKGLAAARVSSSGQGEAVPVASNDTASGRQQNRRVELIITQ